MNRPNILFAFADDWGRYASAYAELQGQHSINHLISTPNFDRIASEGALFTHAHVPAPSCTPCRSSVLSGRYFWQTGLGAILSGAVWDRRIPSYPFILQDAGYHIGFSDKVWGPGTPQDDPYGGAGNRFQSFGGDFNNFSFYVGRADQTPMGIATAKEELCEQLRGNFRSFIEAREGDRPFCYWWGPTNTHRKWLRGSGKAHWGLEPDQLKGRLPDFLPDVHEVREDVADYLGECMAFDKGLGTLIDELEAMGELDNTLVVVSGDHGIPGFPRAKCNLYDIGCEVALAARLPSRIPQGRVIDDMINIMDLCPTFIDIAGADIPAMAGKSLLPVLQSPQQGQVDSSRTFVITGRERHVAEARDWNLPYPQRAIRTHDFLYIRNYKPDRWPMGDPRGLDDLDATPPSYEELCENTFVAYADMDSSPTKAWMVHHRSDRDVRGAFQLGFDKRLEEELYDLNVDPHCMHNLANHEAYSSIRQKLAGHLHDELVAQQDPRALDGDQCRFEKAPFTDHKKTEKTPEERLAMLGNL